MSHFSSGSKYFVIAEEESGERELKFGSSNTTLDDQREVDQKKRAELNPEAQRPVARPKTLRPENSANL